MSNLGNEQCLKTKKNGTIKTVNKFEKQIIYDSDIEIEDPDEEMQN